LTVHRETKERALRIGMIGVGSWGPKLLRNLVQMNEADVVVVADLAEQNRTKVGQSYPGLRVIEDHREIMEDPDIEAVVIATPAKTHFGLAREALESGKHVLVEKPLCTSTDEALQLTKMASQRGVILMVGHTFLYNAAVRKAKEYIDTRELGSVLYLYGRRVNLGKVRQDVNSLWNFAPHDISIVNYLLSSAPESVQAFGACYLQKDIEDVVFLNMRYPGGVICSLHLSWLDPKKVRQMTIVGTEKMLIYNDVSSDQKIQLIDKGIEIKGRKPGNDEMVNFGEYQVLLRSGDVLIPKLTFVEPLRVECTHFVECCFKGENPLTDGMNGLQVVAVLEAASRSLQDSGSEVQVDYLAAREEA